MPIISLVHQLPMIILALIGVGFLIGFHEFGHFIFCKIFKVSTPSFSIGFGPRLFSKKIGETTFALSAIPLGGYVEIAGAQEVGQGEQKEAHRTDKYSFAKKPYYQKMLIIAGGILFNLSFAYVTLTVLFMLGIPKTPLMPLSSTPIIEKLAPNSPGERAGLQPQDILLQINETALTQENMKGFVGILAEKANQTVSLLVQRGAETIPFAIELGNGSSTPLLGASFVLQDMPGTSLGEAWSKSVTTVNHWIATTFGAFKAMAKQQTTKGLGGPLAIISETVKSIDDGLSIFFIVLCFISVNLAVLNIIPLPIFDGGQALFYTLEAITGRSLNSVRMYIHYISWIFVMVLALYLTCKDLIKICT
jgi:regulator of sigma E protease